MSYPPTFDGNDADYQDFRFSFRIDMSFVSVVSHLLMDKCEAERNQITLASVKPLGEAHLKCCTQMYRRSWPECFSEGAFYNGQYWLPPKFVGKADLGGRLPHRVQWIVCVYAQHPWEWNVSGKYWPHGELFFFLIQEEPEMVPGGEACPFALLMSSSSARLSLCS